MDVTTGGRALPVLTAWLVHPVTVFAVVVLVVNDHLLKTAYPGLVTGKLSDVAGLVFLPPLLSTVLALILPRRCITLIGMSGLAVSGMAFAVVKAVPAGAAAASTVFSAVAGPSVVLADPTDLAALPALGVAAWVCSRARKRSVSRDMLRRFGVVVVLPTATLAVVATTAPDYPDTVEVVAWRDLVVVGQANAYHDRQPEAWLASDQGRAGWRLLSDAEQTAFDRERPRLVTDAEQACVPDDGAHCYRVVRGHLRVEETIDAGKTWTVSWEVSDDRRSYLVRSLERVGNVSANLSSRALAVHPVPGGHVVVVANGRDGCAVRDPDGSWRRVAFSPYGAREVRSAPLDGSTRLIDRELVLAVLVALLALHVGVWAVTSRTDGSVTAVWIVAAAGLIGMIIGVGGLVAGDLLEFAGWAAIVLGLVVTLAGTISALAVATRQAVHATRWLLLTLLVALASGAAWAAPFLGWVRGELTYPQAMLLAAAASAAGTALAAYLGDRARRLPAAVEPAS